MEEVYDGSNEEGPLEGINLLCAFWHGVDVLHLIDEIGCILWLHIEEDEPEVDTDASEHRAEVATTEVELLFRCEISHFNIN